MITQEFTAGIIGTRKPDSHQLTLARRLSTHLTVERRCRVKTGAAFGIDQAAMEGAAPGYLTAILPWSSYNLAIVPEHAEIVVFGERRHAHWLRSVRTYHPAFARLSYGAKALHARNYGIVENDQLVIAFPNESGGGGTGQGIRIAHGLHIPVIEIRRGQLTTYEEAVRLIDSHLARAAGLSPSLQHPL